MIHLIYHKFIDTILCSDLSFSWARSHINLYMNFKLYINSYAKWSMNIQNYINNKLNPLLDESGFNFTKFR